MLDIKPEVQAELARQAAVQCQPVEVVAAALLEDAVHLPPASTKAQKKGVTLAVVDGIIAASALEHGLTLVTRNTKHFDALGIALVHPWLDQ
jgi:predicted nucleic acid-binding protein